MSQFERSHQTIQGRMIVITSWFDDTRRAWRASAPAYIHLNTPTEDHGDHSSRKEAIERLSHVLGKRLNDKDSQLSDKRPRSEDRGGGRFGR